MQTLYIFVFGHTGIGDMRRGTHTKQYGWKSEIKRIRDLWARARAATQPHHEAQHREQAEEIEHRLRIKISAAHIKDHATWYAAIDAAKALPPAPPPGPPPAAQAKERVCAANGIPLWHGPSGEWPVSRRVVGLAWCAKMGRFVIRFQTRVGEYVDTNTKGLTPAELAPEVDRIRAHLVYRTYLRPTLRVNCWNEPAAAKGYLDTLDVCASDHDLECEDPLEMLPRLYAHLKDWLKRRSLQAHYDMAADRTGRLRSSFRTIPTQASLDRAWAKKTQLPS